MLSDMPTIPTMPPHCLNTLRDYHPFSSSQELNFRTNQSIGTPLVALIISSMKPSVPPIKIYHKWKTRSKVGVYLGRSPLHNHDVALVFNRDFGLVRPQFHVRYDPLFTTTKDFDLSPLWQVRADFFRQAGHTLSSDDRVAKPAAHSTYPSPQEEANVLVWIHRPLFATLNQRETLFFILNKRETLMQICIHKREHPMMTIPLNQGGHPNLMHISLNKKEN